MRMHTLALGIAVAVSSSTFGAGCVAHALPETFSSGAAASPDADVGASHDVTALLDADPVESALAAPAGPTEHDAHAGHAGHAAPDPHAGHEGQAGQAAPDPHAGHTHTPDAAPESDARARYVCPMHPDEVAPEPGRCSRCGMTLEPRR